MDIPTIAISRQDFYSLPEEHSTDASKPLSRYRTGTGQWVIAGGATDHPSATLRVVAEALSNHPNGALLVVLTDWEEGDDESLRPSGDMIFDQPYDINSVTANGYDAAINPPAPAPAVGTRVSKHRAGRSSKSDRSRTRRKKQLARASKRRNRK